MTNTEMLGHLEYIRSISGSKQKTEALRVLFDPEGPHREPFAEFVLAVIDPNINYYIKEVPVGFEGGVLDDETVSTIHDTVSPTDVGLLISFLTNFIANRKLTGNKAKAAIALVYDILDDAGKTLLSTILSRDLLIGAQVKTLNKAYGGVLIYVPPYMRCSSFNRKNLEKVSFPVYSQTKMDGLFVNVIVSSDSVVVLSRNGQDITHKMLTPELRDSLMGAANNGSFVLHGEGVGLKPDSNEIMPRTEGNGYINGDDVDPKRVKIFVWDMVTGDEFENRKSSRPYNSRLAECEGMVTRISSPHLALVDTIVCTTVEEVTSHFRLHRSNGDEGTVVKAFSLTWKDGTATEQIKIKVEFDCDVRVVGVVEGKNANVGRLGAFEVESSDGIIRCNVGGGFSKLQRENLFTTDMIHRIISVRANDILTKEGSDTLSLFLGRFKSFRDDKNEADSYEEIKRQLDAFIDALKLLET